MENNSARELLKRLLNLVPAAVLKEEYDQKGNVKDIIETVTGNKTREEIVSFIFRSQCYTRQNIYLFTLDTNFNRNSIEHDFPLDIEIENNNDGGHTFFCLPKVTFSVYLDNPVEKENLIFYQPLTIRIKGKSLIIQFTKLESNIKFHYPEDRTAKKNGETNSEESVLKKIVEYLSNRYTVEINDINKGVKHLWEIDDLDCYKIAYRNSFSTDISVMNGTMTFKDKYPEVYLKIILTPIGSAIWAYLLKDDYLCEGFTADLNGGFISITKFPKLPNQVNNVITKILANN